MVKLSITEAIARARKKHGNLYSYKRIKHLDCGIRTKAPIVCPEHGVFVQDLANHLNGSKCPECQKEAKSRSKTTPLKELIKKAQRRHGNRYDYSRIEDELVGVKKKVVIICPEHGPFFQTMRQHIASAVGCPECSGGVALSHDRLVRRIREKFGDTVVVRGEKAFCRVHKKEIEYPLKRVAAGRGCKLCSWEKATEEKKVPQKELVRRFQKKHGKKYDYSKINEVDARGRIKVICHDHGPFFISKEHHARGVRCMECYKESRLKRSKATLSLRREAFLKAAKSIHNNEYKYPFLKKEYRNIYSQITVLCPKCGPVKSRAQNHARGHGCKLCKRSAPEKRLVHSLVKKFPGEILECNNRSIIPPMELDIFFPEKNLAIEYGSVYFHSENKKPTHYHALKQERCSAVGVNLITIFDVDFNDARKKKIIFSRIASALEKTKHRVYARKTEAIEISSEDARVFLNKNHLQGYRPSGTHVGLVDKVTRKLLAVSSYGKPRFNRHYDWELYRSATKLSYTVVGGVSKMVTKFRSLFPEDSIITYADLRWGEGKSYLSAGFTYKRRTPPSRWYADCTFNGSDVLIHRASLQKHMLKEKLTKFDPKLSAEENLRRNHYVAVEDCGTNVYTIERNR